MREKIALVLLALAMIALSACGPASDSGDLAQPQDGQAADEKTSGLEAAASEALQNELLKAFEAKSNGQFKVTYDISMTAEGQTQKSTSTEYVKGATKVRTDVTFQGIESRSYIIDEVFTTCTKFSSKWTCNRFTPSDEPTEEVEIGEIEETFTEEPDEFILSKDGTLLVAGETTTCYKLSSKTSTALTRWCFTKDGVPLYTKMEDTVADYSTEMKATSFSRSVYDSDFNLPAGAEVTEGLGGLGGGEVDEACFTACSEIEDTDAMMACLQSC